VKFSVEKRYENWTPGISIMNVAIPYIFIFSGVSSISKNFPQKKTV
jgi:hypothetical protein